MSTHKTTARTRTAHLHKQRPKTNGVAHPRSRSAAHQPSNGMGWKQTWTIIGVIGGLLASIIVPLIQQNSRDIRQNRAELQAGIQQNREAISRNSEAIGRIEVHIEYMRNDINYMRKEIEYIRGELSEIKALLGNAASR